ncbi:kinesin-related protein 2-like protein [Carex littledalei]|uniref:Kinesin-like protein n=1 Tax=Carex littledalei TaxID=544730 RepID=A0A833RJM8_9POAL|nr:kinesin-related protein 2-like protein [Carex littledalei]
MPEGDFVVTALPTFIDLDSEQESGTSPDCTGPTVKSEQYTSVEESTTDEGKNSCVGESTTGKAGNTEPSSTMEPRPETLGYFMEALDNDCLVESPMLKGVATPDLRASIKLLGTKYNSLMEKNKMEINKCKKECGPRYEALKKKYANECLERRRLYNELIELRGNIRVFCRCRPLNSDEISKGYSNVIDFDPLHETELQIICDSSKKQFKFDHVFGPAANQEAVFAETLPVVVSALDGYNVCIFAYGQTGTGKTFTMEGTPENRGVNYRALEVLFNTSATRSSDVAYGFSVSMLEVYNERIRDLLSESTDQATKKLEIKQSADGTHEVPGLVEPEVCTTDEVWKILRTGARNRSVGSTAANELSSRSHCLVRVTIKSENRVSGQRRRSHMWLVDLAGSERISKIDVEGERLRESQFINRSLSALGDVISALASKNPHIPYRNSKLTHLLQSSLGGDCKTLMFVQISPSSSDLGETTCSLNFATRVRGIEQGPARKQTDPAESFKLKQITEKLRAEEKENARLNESMRLLNMKYTSRENVFQTLQEKVREAEQSSRNYQQRVRELENQLAAEKRVVKDNTATCQFTKPPLGPPQKQRPPLGRITNRVPPMGRPRPTASTSGTLSQNKENTSLAASNSYGLNPQNRGVNKARRVSVAAPLQAKRRTSLAFPPSMRDPQTMNAERKYSQLEQQLSQMRGQRRLSVAVVPATPLVGAYSASNSKYRSIFMSSSKYAPSPPNAVSAWRSRLPTVAASSRQQVRLVRSPANGNGSTPEGEASNSRYCFSVQKRVQVDSLRHQPLRVPQVLTGAGVYGLPLRDNVNGATRFAAPQAKRVLCNNSKRRMSVL